MVSGKSKFVEGTETDTQRIDNKMINIAESQISVNTQKAVRAAIGGMLNLTQGQAQGMSNDEFLTYIKQC